MAVKGLDNIAAQLEGLEETIIHRLIDRAQFRHNPVIYENGKSGFAGEASKSLFDLRLLRQETMDAEFGRFHVPEERPFSSNLPNARRKVVIADTGLVLEDFDRINLSADIRAAYIAFVPRFCAAGDDQQYGSSVEHDVYALQAISRRIHYGAMYVAEMKFRADPDGYNRLISLGDRAGLDALLTRPEVEARVLERVREKVAYAQARVNTAVRLLIDADTVLRFYRDTIIPLTKEGEIRYLLYRG